MIRQSLCTAIAAVFCLNAQDAPSKPPTHREQAAELLTKAGEMVAATRPEVQAAALIHLGDTWTVLDRKKAGEYFDQALAALPGVSEKSFNDYLRTGLISAAAEADPEHAASLLASVPDAPAQAVDRIVTGLLQKKNTARAIAVVETVSATGPFPFRAAQRILETLPADDERRLPLFGAATSAYLARPNNTAFGALLASQWKTVPRNMTETALRALVDTILKNKGDDEHYQQTLSNDQGAVSFSSRASAELFYVMHIVQEIDSKRAEELLRARPDLAGALQRFPGGRAGMGNNVNSNTNSRGRDDSAPSGQDASMNLGAIADARAAEAHKKFDTDQDAALDLAKTIPVVHVRAATLAEFALKLAAQQPERAGQLIDQCLDELKEDKNEGLRVRLWPDLAEAAHKAKRDEQARKMIERGIADAEALYKSDTNADSPNRAIRDEWPSTQAFRRTLYRAAKLFGPDASSYLVRVQDPDLSVLATIEVARALLNRPGRYGSVSISRSK